MKVYSSDVIGKKSNMKSEIVKKTLWVANIISIRIVWWKTVAKRVTEGHEASLNAKSMKMARRLQVHVIYFFMRALNEFKFQINLQLWGFLKLK